MAPLVFETSAMELKRSGSLSMICRNLATSPETRMVTSTDMSLLPVEGNEHMSSGRFRFSRVPCRRPTCGGMIEACGQAGPDVEGLHVNPRYPLAWAERMAESRAGARMLDFGCGDGAVVAAARARGLEMFGAETFYEGG